MGQVARIAQVPRCHGAVVSGCVARLTLFPSNGFKNFNGDNKTVKQITKH